MPSRVILLGGNSNTGKSTVAKQLAGMFNLRRRKVDDLRQSIERSVPRGDPIRRFIDSAEWIDRADEWPPQRLTLAVELCSTHLRNEVLSALDDPSTPERSSLHPLVKAV